MATKTAIILLSDEGILIWTIPPLSPQPPDFFDHNPTHVPLLFTLPLPDAIVRLPKCTRWLTIDSWYFGCSHPLYFDMWYEDSKLHRFQVILKPDLSAASLHVISGSAVTPYVFGGVSFDEDYRICEDALVTCWIDHGNHLDQYQYGVYMGLMSARFANVISQRGPAANMPSPDIGEHYYRLSLCPASGRLVCLGRSNTVAVLDIF